MIKQKYYIRKEGKKSTKKGYILGTWLLGQQVLEAGIIDIYFINLFTAPQQFKKLLNPLVFTSK